MPSPTGHSEMKRLAPLRRKSQTRSASPQSPPHRPIEANHNPLAQEPAPSAECCRILTKAALIQKCLTRTGKADFRRALVKRSRPKRIKIPPLWRLLEQPA